MSEETASPATVTDTRRPRPLVLTALCLFSYVYYGILSLLLGLAVVYSGWITRLVNHYNPGKGASQLLVSAVFLFMFLLHGLCFTGTIGIWRRKKRGYYLYGISALIICFYQLFQPAVPIYSTAIPVILLILFGLFYRRLS